MYKFLQYTSVPDWWGHDGARHELRRRTEYSDQTSALAVRKGPIGCGAVGGSVGGVDHLGAPPAFTKLKVFGVQTALSCLQAKART